MATIPHRLDALTGLRFPAAAAVVVHHVVAWAPDQLGLPARATADLPLGATAVTLFFVLSGFILFYTHPVLPGPGAAGRFLLARFARLYPAHLVGLALSMAALGYVRPRACRTARRAGRRSPPSSAWSSRGCPSTP